MDNLKKNLNGKLFTPVKIACMVILILAVVVSWQQVRMHIQDRAIAKLSRENTSLKNDLFSLDDQLVELKDAASDVRIFQQELIKVIKDIDQNYPISLAEVGNKNRDLIYDKNKGTNGALINAHENIFRLSNSQQNLRLQTA